jgi:hypothetical protein
MDLPDDKQMQALAVVAVVAGLLYAYSKTSGGLSSIGTSIAATVNDVVAIPSAIVSAANNPSINPLQPVGAAIGGALYDLTNAISPSPSTATGSTAANTYFGVTGSGW